MPKPTLDDVHWHPLAGELDRVRMSQLVWGKPRRTPSAASLRSPRRGGRRPGSAAGRAVEDAEQRPDRQHDPLLKPPLQVLDPSLVHPAYRRLSFFPCLISNDPRRCSTSVSLSASASETPRPARQSTAH
jgi:hypothetical protein